jgi:predicted AAA+ superfamily ATPase
VDRDVADLLKVRKTDTLRKLIDQLAARTACELNVQQLSSALGIQRPTLEQWLDVISRLSLATRLASWTPGETGRDIKAPKLHFVDTGVAATLRGLDAKTFGANPSPFGGLVETFVFGELQKNLLYQQTSWRLYHWRDQRGREVDILADSGNALVGCEAKASATVTAEDFRHLQWFMNTGPGCKRTMTGIVFYLGAQPLSFGPRLFALPLSVFWSFPEATSA